MSESELLRRQLDALAAELAELRLWVEATAERSADQLDRLERTVNALSAA
jgi:hypothetical protein